MFSSKTEQTIVLSLSSVVAYERSLLGWWFTITTADSCDSSKSTVTGVMEKDPTARSDLELKPEMPLLAIEWQLLT